MSDGDIDIDLHSIVESSTEQCTDQCMCFVGMPDENVASQHADAFSELKWRVTTRVMSRPRVSKRAKRAAYVQFVYDVNLRRNIKAKPVRNSNIANSEVAKKYLMARREPCIPNASARSSVVT